MENHLKSSMDVKKMCIANKIFFPRKTFSSYQFVKLIDNIFIIPLIRGLIEQADFEAGLWQITWIRVLQSHMNVMTSPIPDIHHIVSNPTGGRLNKKDGLTRYGDSHVKDKTS